MTTEKQSTTTDKQETETTETKSKPFPKKALGMSLASVAVAAALGFGVAYANGVFTPKAAPTPPAVASQEATKENKIEDITVVWDVQLVITCIAMRASTREAIRLLAKTNQDT